MENEKITDQKRNVENFSTINSDLPDNQHDLDRMQPEEAIIDLPGVEDIPGQEFIHPPKMKSFSDTTISSADEEGEGIFDEDEEESDLD